MLVMIYRQIIGELVFNLLSEIMNRFALSISAGGSSELFCLHDAGSLAT